MRKIDKYGFFYILSSCQCANEVLQDLDGTEFRYLSEAVDFYKKNKELIDSEGNNIFIMVWKEYIDEYGNYNGNECVDDISFSEIMC